MIGKLADVFELNEQEWDTILALYQATLSSSTISTEDSFNNLDSDSLSFVSLSIELENTLGPDLPLDWAKQTIENLDTIYSKVKYG